MIVTELTQPPVEPVSLAEAKAHLKVEHDEEDALIGGLIAAARVWAESFTRRCFVQRQLRLTLDAFPCSALEPLLVPSPPLRSVTAISYIDSDGASQTWSSALYLVDASSQPGRITPVYGGAWPSTQPRIAAVTIDYLAGYAEAGSPGDYAANVPEPVKLAMKLLLTQWYENRSEVAAGQPLQAVPNGAKALLWPLRALTL